MQMSKAWQFIYNYLLCTTRRGISLERGYHSCKNDKETPQMAFGKYPKMAILCMHERSHWDRPFQV